MFLGIVKIPYQVGLLPCRHPGGFSNHRNRPEACPGQPGSSQQGLKNPGGAIAAASDSCAALSYLPASEHNSLFSPL
jgi:hypothetical protein